ncbi:stage V sporulation protein AD [Caldisalinibacter kiritimatiensis]|uniref:Stage V sporulation protein AD (SpoVAD) n=1 Tax=Caldisalinibacter kiritimatiensis TaxID=1304284 RepID=R1CY65_9FIRM|nr:stage V sporulation protein AD [Caldisalinibacter kiritimatiensis]EOD01514.1 Stage V sporulation protein AD (SpoVAD) [Caldisalinibacter kiritimatiensis]
MAKKKLGKQTVVFDNPPSIISTASIVGPKEGQGPLKDYFDMVLDDDLWGQGTWEKCESKMQQEAVKMAIRNGDLKESDIEYLFAGDLLNQIISSSYAARQLQMPYFGLYGACSTMTLSLSLGSITIDGGYGDKVVCVTSSHFSTAERQYRFPLELGNQRPPTSQWTVTGAGAAVLSANGNGPYITHVTTGKIVDPGVKDVNNMGAAMAPAAADTIVQHFKDTGFTIEDYDLIITGDLAAIGKEIAQDLMIEQGYDVSSIYTDCGIKIFDNEKQDTHAGGSGCGCSATVFCGYLYKELQKGTFNRILLVSTGALHSPTSALQGESIPGIAHAVSISNKIS